MGETPGEMGSMVAALYVQRGGIYDGVPGVEAWAGPPDRDARLYAGPWPVVAHPPCARWGRYWSGGPNALTPRRMGELARCLHLVPSAVTSAADRLEAQGLIQRVKDPSDRRAFLLRLTRRGNRHRARIEQSCSAALRTICGLSGQEFDLLLQLSGKIKETPEDPGHITPGKET